MHKKFTLLFVFGLLATLHVRAQQDPMYSQYMFNMLAINPAYAGNREVLSITGLYRRQWAGFDGAPISQTISADMPIQRKTMGIGLQMYNDQLGVMRNTGAYASGSYRLRLSKGTLAFGMQLGVTQFQADLTSVFLGDDRPDQAFAQNVVAWLPNVGSGVFYSTDRFYIGASVPHLLKNRLNRGEYTLEVDQTAAQYRHLFVSSGYVFDLSPSVKLKPALQLKTVGGAPLQLDVNANAWFHDRFAVGLSYRTGDSMLGMVEFQVNNQFRLGYAYDYTLTKLARYNSGSHELMLRYELGFRRDRIISPRYF
jgi:type IX secretion system PorP/SprF family membrane protein